MRLAVLAEGGLVLLAVGLGWWVGTPPFGRFRWEWGAVAAGVAGTAPLLVGLLWCLRTRWPPVVRLTGMVRERVAPLLAGAGAGELGLVALLAGVGEEALFRGFLQDGLTGPLPAWAALAVAGLLFGVVHWLTTTYALLAGVVGLYLGVLFLVTGNLLAPIVTHALYDLVALAVLVRMKPDSARSVV